MSCSTQSVKYLRWQETVVWLGLVVALFCLWWRGLIWGEIPAFRDTFHFYYPLQVWLDAQAKAGDWFPLWNSRDGLGIGTAGEATTALFYPLRCIWWLPGLAVAQRCAIFIVLHLLLAAIAVRYAGGRLGFSCTSSCLAAVAYALSGPVSFLHVNLPYLCGAAWAPFVLAELGRLTQNAHSVRTWVLAGAIAMMLLAGDIQTAVNAVLLMVIVSGGRIVQCRDRGAACGTAVVLVRSLLLAASLSAIQWLPTLHAALQSERFMAAYPTTTPAGEVNRNAGPIWRDHPMQSVSRPSRIHAYDFSIPPWHFISLVWPTVGGHFVPDHSRWFQALPAEGRMWTPSLYQGTLPLLLLISGIAPWMRCRWLVGLTILCGLLSMGNYGPIWFLRQMLVGFGLREWTSSFPADHVGSLSSLLNMLVPGYGAFRYPGKWIIWVTCGLSLLCAHQFDQQRSANAVYSNRLSRLLFGFSIAGLSACLATQYCPELGWYDRWSSWLANCPKDIWLGTPDAGASLAAIQLAFALPLFVILLGAVAMRLGMPRPNRETAVILLTAIEMTLCCGTWTSFVTPASMHQRAFALSSHGEFAWSSLARANFEADTQAQHSDFVPPDRVQLMCEYQQTLHLGKLHLLGSASNLSATLSLEPSILKNLRSILNHHDNFEPVNAKLDEYLSWLGVNRRLIRRNSNVRNDPPPHNTSSTDGNHLDANLVWQSVPHATPFVELVSMDGSQLDKSDSLGSVQVFRHGSSRLELHTDCISPARLVIRQHDDGLWRAYRAEAASAPRGSRLAIELYARLFQSVTVPRGKSVVRLEYFPWPMWFGAGVSVITLAFAIVSWQWHSYSRGRGHA